MGKGKRPSEAPENSIPEAGTLPSYEDVQNASTSMVSGTADATDDGRISVNLDSKLARVFAKLIPVEDETDGFDSPPEYSVQSPWILPMNIVVQVVGSRGDVQPFVALGSELRMSGHRVRIATHSVFKDFVQNAGLEFYPIGGDPAELMAYMVKNPGLIPNMKTLRKGEIKRKRKMIAEMLQGCWKSCIEPDPDTNAPFVANAIIANPVSFAHVHCAEALSIPLHMVFTMPWSPTRAFPHPLANIHNSSTDPRLANYLSYGLVQILTWQGQVNPVFEFGTFFRLGDIINDFRTTLDLHSLPLTEAPFILETLKVPTTYVWSPSLVPKPTDWPSHIDVSGFIFRSQSTYTYTPPTDLTDFLNAGPPPLYIGFGSIVIEDPATLFSKILFAISQTGVRAIISKGWSDFSSNTSTSTDIQPPPSNPNILYLPDCPHEYLFPLVSATIHHGGSGTTAASLLAAKPTLVIPFFGDQPFWGDRIAASGAGPPPIPHKKLTIDNLISAIAVLLSPETQQAAQRISSLMQQENGVKNTVDSFHRHLSQPALSCDISSTSPAVYEVSLRPTNPLQFSQTRTVKLSASAVEILLKHDRVKASQLRLYEPRKIIVENRRWDPVTSAGSSAVRAGVELLRGVNGIWYEPWRVSVAARERERQEGKGKGKGRSCSVPDGAEGSTSASTSNVIGDASTQRDDASISSSQHTSQSQNQSQHKGTNKLKSKRKGKEKRKEKRKEKQKQKQKDTDQTTGTSEIITASAMSIPRLTGTMTKSVLIDTPYAIVEGFRNTPKLYGEEVADHQPVTDWKSGAIVGGKEFGRGLATGVVDIFVQPYKGAKEDGAVGFVTGIGKGVMGTFSKLGTAGLALWAYPAQGCWKSVYDALHGDTRKKVFSARRIHDLYYAKRDHADEKKVLEAFEKLQSQ